MHLLREVAKGRTSERYPYLVHLPRYYHTASFYSSFEAQALQVTLHQANECIGLFTTFYTMNVQSIVLEADVFVYLSGEGCGVDGRIGRPEFP